MPVFTNKLSFVVPTKDRPDELRRLLASLAAQSALPAEVIVVDGSGDPVRGSQRNAGLSPSATCAVCPPRRPGSAT